MDYRTNAPRIEDPPMLPPGPATKCPACGAEALDEFEDSTGPENTPIRTVVGRHEMSRLPAPRACTPRKRFYRGFFRWCKVEGAHLHEHCRNCGHDWLTRFAGET